MASPAGSARHPFAAPAVRSASRIAGVSVRSARGAVPVFRPVRFPGPPPEPGVHVSVHRALHTSRLGVMVPQAAACHGDGMTAPRYW
jgi:hypothetical protein